MADGVIQALHGRLDDAVAKGKLLDGLSEGLTKLDELRLTVKAYEIGLSTAKAEYDGQWKSSRQQHNLRSPIYRMPDEVLATIMEESFEDVFMTEAGRMFLASVVGVSRRWYNIAVSIPRLWRGIEYVDSQSSAANTRWLKRAEIFLQRSKLLPIRVRFAGTRPELSRRGIEFMDAVQAHLGRIEQLEFYSISDMPIAELFPIRCTLPHLHKLDICFGMDDNEYFEELDYEPLRTMTVPLISPGISISTIQTLIIRIAGGYNLDLHGIDMSKLTSVELRAHLNYLDIPGLLARCTNLESLSLCANGVRDDHDGENQVQLPRLTSYKGTGSLAIWFSRFVFNAPQLKNVEYQIAEGDDESIESFLDVCDYPGLIPWPNLETFTLDTEDDDRLDKIIGRFLICHPRLTSISLPIGVNLGDILEMITPPAPNEPPFDSPHLRVLQLVDSPGLGFFYPHDPLVSVLRILLDRLPGLRIETKDDSAKGAEKFMGLEHMYPGRVSGVETVGFIPGNKPWYLDFV